MPAFRLSCLLLLVLTRRAWGPRSARTPAKTIRNGPRPAPADPARTPVPSRAVTLAALAFAAVETGIETGAGLWGYLFLTAGRGLGHPAAGLAMCGLGAAEPPGRAERPIGDRACAPGGARAADPRPGLRRRAPAPLVEHWDGRAWHRVALPRGLVKPGGPYYPATAAAGPRNLWVFGIDGQWLHWDGAWTTGTLSDATDLDASAMFGPRDVWTFGVLDPNTRPRPYAARYDGSRWHRVAVPGHDGVDGVSAVSPRDIWAVLGAPQTGAWTGPGALVHWNGRRWHAVRLPARLATPRLGSVLARSATDVWAGGATRNRDRGSTEAIGHWNGRRWSVVTLPAPASRVHCHLTQLAADGAGGIWAIGPCANCQRIPSRLWHERAGQWSGPLVPSLARRRWILFGLAAAARSVWAAGDVDGSGPSGLIALWAPARSFG